MTETSALRPWELFANSMADCGALRATLRAKADDMGRVQAALIDQAASLSQAWFARRREGAAATQAAALAMCDAADMMEAGRIYQQWLSASLERLVADGVDTQTRIAGMAQLILDATPAAAQEVEPAAPAPVEAQGRRAA